MHESICRTVLLVGACMLTGAPVWGQQSQKPATPGPVFIDMAVTYSPERTELVPGSCCFWMQGGGIDAAISFWHGLGLAASLTGEHAGNYVPGMDVNILGYMAGPRYTYTAWNRPAGSTVSPRLQVFGEGLFGGVHAFNGAFPSGAGLVAAANSFGLQTGGGINVFFTRNLGMRLLEADFVRTQLPNGASNIQHDMRLGFGVTYHFSAAPPPPVTLACSASPNSIFPGDPVTVTATAGSLDPKLNALYSITGVGVSGTGATATVATGALAPGSYTVKCGVKEGKPGKEGLKPWQVADASASFTVKAFEPPTISCSANPSTIKPGETATVTAQGMSPQNRPLTYSYAATSGTVSGSGASATFNSTGAPTGTAGITCNVSDDKGQTATANTSVTILAPYVAPIPRTQTLCSIAFDKDKKRPSRVDNEAKACLDEVALDLQKQSDAKAVVVGSSDAKEKDATAKEAKRALKNKHVKVVDLAAERAVNAKEYLVTDKGIDATRVSVATGTADGQKVEDYLVPSGATFANDVTGTTPVNEAAVKPVVRKPLAEKHHAKKPAASTK